MRKYALINNDVITDIKDLEEGDIELVSKANQLVIDIEDLSPQPMIRWVLNGNKLEIPQGASDREQFEIKLAEDKCAFGTKLSHFCVTRIGARNKILNKTGPQVTVLLNTLLPIKLLLETGALGTARFSCVQLKDIYTEYSDIFIKIIEDINAFEQSNGL